jgi:hypothetical protein
LRISHGYEVKETNDPFVDLADTALEQFSLATTPGGFLVDVVPICQFALSTFFSELIYHSETCPRLVPWCPFQETSKDLGSDIAGIGRPAPQLCKTTDGRSSMATVLARFLMIVGIRPLERPLSLSLHLFSRRSPHLMKSTK